VVIFENDKFLFVNKPASMPVHPCGNFKLNCLQEILDLEFGYREGQKGRIRTVHRLDR